VRLDSRPLLNGALIDPASGAELAPCACDTYQVAHREIVWNQETRFGLASRRSLQRYLVYQDAVAAGLTGLPVVVRAASADPVSDEEHVGTVTVELRGPRS